MAAKANLRRALLFAGALLGVAGVPEEALGGQGAECAAGKSCGAQGDASAMLQTKAISPHSQADEATGGGRGPLGAPSHRQLRKAREAADANVAGEELVEPQVVRSPVTLKVQAAELPVPWIGGTFWTRAYGSIPGPTIRVKPGERLKIILKNDLGPGPGYEGCDMKNSNLGFFLNPDTICALNHTNLHVHGLHVSAKGDGDNIQRHVAPGERKVYHIPLPPNHMAGTHWYHPHFHHATAAQAGGGLHGAIIVEDPKGSLPKSIEDMPEKLLFLSLVNVAKAMRLEAWSLGTLAKGDIQKQQMWTSSAYPDWSWNPVTGTMEEHGSALSDSLGLDPHLVVNGMYKPKVTFEEGKWYRLRIVFAAIEQRVELYQVEDSSSQALCNFQLLAKDGVYLHEAPRAVGKIFLASGSRADVAVQCRCGFMAPRPCRSSLYFAAVWQPMGMMGMTPTLENTTNKLLEMVTVGNERRFEPPIQTFSVRRPCYLVDLREVRTDPKNRHQVHMAMMYPMAVKVDGKGSPWGHGVPPPLKEIPVGEVQEWHIKGIQFHPWHLHVNPYQITGIWADPWYLAGDWHDTMLPTTINFATIKVNVDRFTGEMIAHCHLLEHEDNGMMGYWEITGKEGTMWEGAKTVDPECYNGFFPGPPKPKAPPLWR